MSPDGQQGSRGQRYPVSVFCLGVASWKGAGLASDTADTVKVSIPGSGRLDSGGEGAHGGNTP